MPRFRIRAGAAAAAVVLRASLCEAAGANVPEPVHLDYLANGDCPDQRAFENAVGMHTSLFRLAERGEWARPLRIRVDTTSEGDANGEFSIAGSELRKVSGGSCSEVLEALALFVALAVDPSASAEFRSINRCRVWTAPCLWPRSSRRLFFAIGCCEEARSTSKHQR